MTADHGAHSEGWRVDARLNDRWQLALVANQHHLLRATAGRDQSVAFSGHCRFVHQHLPVRARERWVSGIQSCMRCAPLVAEACIVSKEKGTHQPEVRRVRTHHAPDVRHRCVWSRAPEECARHVRADPPS